MTKKETGSRSQSFADAKELIKERADLANRVSRDTKLFKTGQGYKACCPLPGHSEKSPSFHVNTRDNYYYCFGCQRGGDIFSYLEETQGLSFFDALKELAEEYHIELPQSGSFDKGAKSEAKSQRDEALSILERACKYFEENLLRGTSPAAEQARSYLANRGYDLEFAKELRLGWAPESGNRIASTLRDNKLSKLGEDVGLLARGRITDDFFKARLMIPIEDHRGRVVAFSGRALGSPLPDNIPKYKNSPESIVFKKKEILYGLHRANRRARELGWICIVEGFFDAWAFERRGIPAVAVMGVALSEEHLTKLTNTCNQVVLVMDVDRAGVESTKRSLPLLYSKGFEVKVFSALNGKDPDEWLKGSGISDTELERTLQKAHEGMEWWGFQVIQESREKGLNPLQIVHRLEELWPILQSPLHKRLWIRSMAEQLGLSEDQLATHFKQVATRDFSKPNNYASPQNETPAALSVTFMNSEKASADFIIKADLLALLFQQNSAFKNLAEMPEAEFLLKTFEGDPLGEILAQELKDETFDSQRLKRPLFEKGLGALLARSLVADESESTGALGSTRDPRRSLRDLCVQIQSLHKKDLIKKLSLELKTSAEDAKTAHILQQIQELRHEVEKLKNFSFSE